MKGTVAWILSMAYTNKHGGGGSGTNYNNLENLPKINEITLQGNKTSDDLGIVDTDVVADEFDSTLAYSIGDFVLYHGDLYEFTSEHTENTPWDSSEVSMWSIGDVIESIKSALNDVPESITLTQAQYDALPQSEKLDTSKIYYISDGVEPVTESAIDDTTTATNKVWSSQKTSNEFANKVDKVTGKGLSTNDYTTNEKNKLSGIESGAEENDINSISVNGTAINPDANKNVNIVIPTVTIPIDDTTTGLDKLWSSSKVSSELGNKINASAKGVANGVASLGNDGKIPSSQLPSLDSSNYKMHYDYGLLELYSSMTLYARDGQTPTVYPSRVRCKYNSSGPFTKENLQSGKTIILSVHIDSPSGYHITSFGSPVYMPTFLDNPYFDIYANFLSTTTTPDQWSYEFNSGFNSFYVTYLYKE